VGRSLLSLWRCLLRVALPVPILVGLVALNGTHSRLLPLAVVAVVIGQFRSRSVWRLAAAVRRFRTLADGRVGLHYDPAVVGRYDLPALARRCGADLDRLAAWFGRPIRRPAVFLFSAHADVGRLFGPRYGGAALAEANAVVVAAGDTLREDVRHELAHLFAARWNSQAPPLLGEGLAVWLQGTNQGEPIDAMAWPWIGEPGLGLQGLLDEGFFFAEQRRHTCYLLAGSFTGFLLRRYGQKAYRRLYARASRRNFGRELHRCMGVSLDEAERQWRYELLIGGPLGRKAGSAESPWAAELGGAVGTSRDEC